jgi:putative tricarboxylic transport membrane protein
MNRLLSASTIAAALLFILGSAALYGAIDMGIGTPDVPDAGFFPLIASLALVALAGVQLFGAIGSPSPPVPPVAEESAPASPRMALSFIVSLVAYVAALQWLGFLIATALLVAVILAIFGMRRPLPYAIAVPVLAGGSYLLFDLALGLRLPAGPFGF